MFSRVCLQVPKWAGLWSNSQVKASLLKNRATEAQNLCKWSCGCLNFGPIWEGTKLAYLSENNGLQALLVGLDGLAMGVCTQTESWFSKDSDGWVQILPCCPLSGMKSRQNRWQCLVPKKEVFLQMHCLHQPPKAVRKLHVSSILSLSEYLWKVSNSERNHCRKKFVRRQNQQHDT